MEGWARVCIRRGRDERMSSVVSGRSSRPSGSTGPILPHRRYVNFSRSLRRRGFSMSAYFRIFFEILLSSPGNPFTFLEPFFRWCWSCSLQTPMLSGIASEVSFLFQSRDLHTRLSVLKEVRANIGRPGSGLGRCIRDLAGRSGQPEPAAGEPLAASKQGR